MIIEPDADQARIEQAEMVETLRPMLPPGAMDGVDPRSPGTFALGFGRRTGRWGPDANDFATLAERDRRGRERAERSGCPAWSLDLAEPEPHLAAALARAADQAPEVPGRGRPRVEVGRWRPEDRDRWCASACLLRWVWPELLAELRVTVRQLVVIEGRGVGGFAADFGAHGAVFINRRRLGDGEGMPGRIRYAEHLAHESTHVRLHAAAGSQPFLVAPGDRSVLVTTPLRADPRPLNGLFQQFVVLTRCRALFDRMLASDVLHDAERGPAADRRELLADQAARTATLLCEHRGALTDRGRAVLDEAGVAAR